MLKFKRMSDGKIFSEVTYLRGFYNVMSEDKESDIIGIYSKDAFSCTFRSDVHQSVHHYYHVVEVAPKPAKVTTVGELVASLSTFDPSTPYTIGVDCNDDTLRGESGHIEIRPGKDGSIQICGWSPNTTYTKAQS